MKNSIFGYCNSLKHITWQIDDSTFSEALLAKLTDDGSFNPIIGVLWREK